MSANKPKQIDVLEGGLATVTVNGVERMVRVVLLPLPHPNRPRERAIVECTESGRRFEVPVPALNPVVVTLPGASPC